MTSTYLKTSIALGLMNVPVRMKAAIGDEDAFTFHQYHVDCGGQLRLGRKCEKCSKALDWDDLVSGVQLVEDGPILTVTKEERDALGDNAGHALGIAQTVDLGDVDPIAFAGVAYFLEPEPTDKVFAAYHTLRQAMLESNIGGVAKFTTRGKTKIALLRADSKKITAYILLWPGQIRSSAELKLGDGVKPQPGLLKQAKEMLGLYQGSFGLLDTESEYASEYVNQFDEDLRDLVGRKDADPSATVTAVELDQTAKVDDLQAMLEAEIAAKKAAKSAPKKAVKRAPSTVGRVAAKAASKASHPAGKQPAAKAPAKKAAPRKKVG